MKRLGITAALIVALLAVVTMAASRKVVGERPIIFDHTFHLEDVGMECADCHAGMETAAAGERFLPDHEICGMCHDQVEADDGCGTCHTDPDNPTPMPPVAGGYEGFTHQRHSGAGLDCRECHGGAGEPVIPAMGNCQSCHSKRDATLDCAMCHLGERPRPTDHLAGTWLQDHGLEASLGTADCRACHDEQGCDDCHQGTAVFGDRGSPHPPTWLFDHATAADFSGNCLTCHETRRSCTECHRRTIPAPHPFGAAYANTTDGGEHQDDFRAFPESCLACHDTPDADPTCARCH